MKKFLGFLMVALMFSAMAMADWSVPGKHFGLRKGMTSSRRIAPPPAGGETET